MKVKIGRWPKVGDRKVDIKIESFDTWNLDSTLALIILPALIQLKETKHGIPNEFGRLAGQTEYDGQFSFDFYEETHNEAFEIACKKWDEVLDKMIWSFQQIALEDYDEQYHHGKAEYGWEKTGTTYANPITGKQEETHKLVDLNPNEHWYDHVGHRLHEDRIQEGLDLFGKYYRNLWD